MFWSHLQKNIHTLTSTSRYWRAFASVAIVTSAWMVPAAAQTIQTGKFVNRAEVTYQTSSGGGGKFEGRTNLTEVEVPTLQLTDPFGQVLNCDGGLLPDYSGYSVGLYAPDPTDITGTEVAGIVPLTQTEVPDNPNNRIPAGLLPNGTNVNPYFLSNGEEGRYNFLFDRTRGQIDPNSTYILLVSPPPESTLGERRVRIRLGVADAQNRIPFTAQSLDGNPISFDDGRQSVEGFLLGENIERIGLALAIFRLNTCVTETQPIQIIKSADRASAAPGDTIIYRLTIRNLVAAPINNVTITDVLPRGFNLLPDSVQGEIEGTAIAVSADREGSTVSFGLPNNSVPANAVLNLVYAAEITPDALRGSGENSAIVNGQRADNLALRVKDGPAIHRVRLQEGIVRDSGTLIGRVFVDKNFDGEQQRGEPGVPDAVIFLADGNRVTTDANGLFSVTDVLPGPHTGVLDLSSLPGYTLAPNLYFVERNSQSRLVNLAPGGMARMNFAVTPTFLEGDASELSEPEALEDESDTGDTSGGDPPDTQSRVDESSAESSTLPSAGRETSLSAQDLMEVQP